MGLKRFQLCIGSHEPNLMNPNHNSGLIAQKQLEWFLVKAMKWFCFSQKFELPPQFENVLETWTNDPKSPPPPLPATHSINLCVTNNFQYKSRVSKTARLLLFLSKAPKERWKQTAGCCVYCPATGTAPGNNCSFPVPAGTTTSRLQGRSLSGALPATPLISVDHIPTLFSFWLSAQKCIWWPFER